MRLLRRSFANRRVDLALSCVSSSARVQLSNRSTCRAIDPRRLQPRARTTLFVIDATRIPVVIHFDSASEDG